MHACDREVWLGHVECGGDNAAGGAGRGLAHGAEHRLAWEDHRGILRGLLLDAGGRPQLAAVPRDCASAATVQLLDLQP